MARIESIWLVSKLYGFYRKYTGLYRKYTGLYRKYAAYSESLTGMALHGSWGS
jgi:hypothetical protein